MYARNFASPSPLRDMLFASLRITVSSSHLRLTYILHTPTPTHRHKNASIYIYIHTHAYIYLYISIYVIFTHIYACTHVVQPFCARERCSIFITWTCCSLHHGISHRLLIISFYASSYFGARRYPNVISLRRCRLNYTCGILRPFNSFFFFGWV